MNKALRTLDGVREIKQGEDISEFIVTVDAKKLPLPSALKKTVPDSYDLEAVILNGVSGEASLKDGRPQFTGAVPDRAYVLVKDEDAPAEEGKPHPFAALTEALKAGAQRIELTGVLTEGKKDDKTVLTVAVGSWKKVEPKKENGTKRP